MTKQKWTRIALVAAVAGGVAWLGKIVSYGGLGGPLEAPLFLLGLLGMVIGATGIATALPLRSRALLAVAVVGSLVAAYIVLFSVFEPLGLALLDGLLPPAAAGEGGILLTALVVLVAATGALLLSRRTAGVPSGQ